MKNNSSAIGISSISLSTVSARAQPHAGLLWGLLGVIAFAFTVPCTRIAVDAGLDPILIGGGRAVVAAALATLTLGAVRVPFPTQRQWVRLIPVSLGVVVGFPVLTSLALPHTTAGHAAVVIGMLPAATAVVAALLTRERPSARFWCGAALGVAATATFTLTAHGSLGGAGRADLYLVGAVVLAALGYAQGGLLSRELGSWQTICWALVLAAPVMAAATAMTLAAHPPRVGATGWVAFGYLAAISMFLGFFAWYRGLAIGPMTTVSQIQLGQPVLTVAISAVLLGESLTWPILLGGAAVIACAAVTVRARIR
ncbi:MAG: DMT family transporter [Gordonia sp. (in: high G+C Gram-positive bacteria)]